MLQRFLGRGVEIVSSGAPVARQVEHVLGSRGLGSPETGEGTYGFGCTGDPEGFRTLGTRFLQLPLGEVDLVRTSSGSGALAEAGP
jgi:glutamate racemase